MQRMLRLRDSGAKVHAPPIRILEVRSIDMALPTPCARRTSSNSWAICRAWHRCGIATEQRNMYDDPRTLDDSHAAKGWGTYSDFSAEGRHPKYCSGARTAFRE